MQKRIYYFDILKVLACFLVIINHTSIPFTQGYMNEPTLLWMMDAFIFFLSKSAVPIFILITGALLINKERNYQYSLIKFRNMFLILIFWDFCYRLTLLKSLSEFDPIVFIKSFIYGPSRTHLWYLYMLVCFYLMLPLLQKMASRMKRQDYEYFIVLWLFFSSLLPFIHVIDTTFYISNYFSANLFIGYIGCFFLGYYLHHYLKPTRGAFWISVGAIIISVTVMVLLTYLQSDKTTHHVSDNLDNVLLLPIIIATASIFVMVKYLITKHQYQEAPIILELSRLSFGIYLIHVFIIGICYKYPPFSTFLNIHQIPFSVRYLLLDLFIFSVSAFICWIISKIPYLQKLILYKPDNPLHLKKDQN